MNRRKVKVFVAITIATLLFSFTETKAQGLSEKIMTYKEICIDLRTSIENLDAKGVRDCEQRFLSAMDTFSIKEASLFPVDETTKELSLDGHIVFDVAYIDSLIKYNMDFSLAEFDSHTAVRETSSPSEKDIYVALKVIPANGELNYKYYGSGEMQLAIVTERKEPFSVVIVSNGSTQTLKAENGSIEHVWNLPSDYNDAIEIKIENLSEQDLSCIIISN